MAGTMDLPCEFALAAACCRWPPAPSRDGAIRAAASGAIDWDRFLRIVKYQRVDGLAYAALGSAEIELPSSAAETLARRAQKIARRNLALAAETVRLQELFGAARIPVLVLKGFALAQSAYGSLALKHSKDIDLLVARDRAEEALALLERNGYDLWQPASHLDERQKRIVMRYGNEVALLRRQRRLEVELRWRLDPSESLLVGVDGRSANQAIAISGGGRVLTLKDDDLFAYLCVHGAAHGWSRLKWLADLNAWLAPKDDTEILRLYRHAIARGSGVCAGLALLLCCRLFGRRLPESLESALQESRRLKLLTAISMNVMAGAGAETELEVRPYGSTRIAVMQFLLGGGWRNFASQCRVLSIRLDDVIRYPLPASLHFLYPMLRLPLWLWRRLITPTAPRRAGQKDLGSLRTD